MDADDLDRALAEEPIVPSSGFVTAVMASVLQDARLPAPIPFPWLRAVTGLAAAILFTVAVPTLWPQKADALGAGGRAAGYVQVWVDWVVRLVNDPDMPLIVAAVLVTYAVVDIPRRLTSRT